MIPVKVKEIVMDQSHNPLLLLVDMKEQDVLPVGIGFWEAQAIALKLKGQSSPRPMTHDLMGMICGELGARVEKIEIYDVYEDTFYANIYLEKEKEGEEVIVDARPSDAIALAMTVGASIYLSNRMSAYTVSAGDLVIENEEDEENGEEGPTLH